MPETTPGSYRLARTARRCLAIALALFVAAGPAAAQKAPAESLDISLAEALDLARSNNPGFLATSNDMGVADWSVRSAYASLFPSASASSGLGWRGSGEDRFGSITSSQLGFGGQPSYYSSSFSIGLNYRLDGGTLLAPGQAKAGRDQTGAQIRVAAVELDRQVTTAYLEVLRQREQVTLTTQQLESARLNLRLARGQREVGQVTVLDVQQAEVQVGRGEVSLLLARQALDAARIRLLQGLGLPITHEVVLTSDFGLAVPEWETDELYALALERSPALDIRRSARTLSDYDVRVAKSTYLPSLSVSTGISGFTQEPSSTDFLVRQAQGQVAGQIAQCEATNDLFARLADPLPPIDCSRLVFTDEQRRSLLARNDAFPFDFTRSPPSVSLSVSIPVFQGLSRQRQLEAARASRADADHQIREQELALQADIAIGVGRARTAYESALIEQRNQALADEQLRLAREQYRVGLIPFLDLVDAETVKAQADQALLAAVFAYHDAVTALEAVVGAPLRTPPP